MAIRWHFTHCLNVILLLTGLMGSPFPALFAARTGSPPARASVTTLTAVPSMYSIFLTWPQVQGATAYWVQGADGDILSFNTWAQLAGTESSYRIDGLEPNWAYTLRVMAFTAEGVVDPDPEQIYVRTMSFQVLLPLFLH